MLGQRVLGLPQDCRQVIDVQLVGADDDGQTAHEFRDHAELDQILGAGPRAQLVLGLPALDDRGPEAQSALADTAADNLFEAVE